MITEQRFHQIRVWIVARNITTFVIVARKARPGQIVRFGLAVVLFRPHVVNLEGGLIQIGRHLTVFTAAVGSIFNGTTLRSADGHVIS